MRNINRLHFMDSLRATAMFLGLVLHGAGVFGEWTLDFMRHHDESSLFVRYFTEVIHVFRMQLFFLVAGFFTMMLYEKRGILNYTKNRFKRIFIPFILCVLLIQPWLASLFLLGTYLASTDNQSLQDRAGWGQFKKCPDLCGGNGFWTRLNLSL